MHIFKVNWGLSFTAMTAMMIKFCFIMERDALFMWIGGFGGFLYMIIITFHGQYLANKM